MPSLEGWQNAGMGGPGGCWTHGISECTNGGVASLLSDVLEDGAGLERYCLSAQACAGILRRAEQRGKRLPEQLEQVLVQVAAA